MIDKPVPHINLLRGVLLFAACISIGLVLTAYSHAQLTSPSAGPANKCH